MNGATLEINGKDFVQAYIEYYNQEEDDKYGEVLGDLNNQFYIEYMSKPTQNSPGLIERRKSEWTLFQTGYMDCLDKWAPEGAYPAEIKTFAIGSRVFAEYPQGGEVPNSYLYENERFGYPAANRTLGSSGCGLFSMATILSGLLGDASIDPITFRDAMEQGEIGYKYHSWDEKTRESNGSIVYYIAHNRFLNDTYGVSVEDDFTYAEAIQALNEGKCILGKEPGHYIAVTAVPNELQGDGYEFFVIDSYRGHTGAYKSVEDYKQQTGMDSISFLRIISLP